MCLTAKPVGGPYKAAHLLYAHPLGHRDDAAVAFHCCYQGQSDTCKKQLVMFLSFCRWHPGELRVFPLQGTCVARGGLDDGVSWFQDTGPLCVLHHPQGDAVLHAASRTEELAFGH